MAIVPENTSDTDIHRMVDDGAYPRTNAETLANGRLNEIERATKVFGHDLDLARATAAAMDRVNALMSTNQRRNMLFDPVPVGHDIGWRCYDGGKHDAESAFESGEYGDWLTQDEAYVAWLVNRPEEAPVRASRVIHSSQFEPPTYSDKREPDFDDDLEQP